MIDFPNDQWDLPIVPGHVGVVYGGERMEHECEKHHPMVI
jgi:hypothetical protein